ncbi:MAG: hypothetical protein IIT40_05305 [Prevotella sp.]|nr:hypothetical protein [Prevotella sp.]
MKTHKDTDLREALRRKYANTPQIPADFSERLMKRMEESTSTKKPRHRHVWLYATIGTIAASILLLLTLPYINKVETKEQPVVTQRHVKQDITMKSEKQLQPQETSIVVSNVQPKHSNIVRKRHDSAKEEDTLSSSSERLQYYIAKLEAEMKNLDDSVREAHLEKLIAADEHLQQLVYSIVNDKAEQTINELRKDSTANYINF